MIQQLFFNLISFDWPIEPITFYFSLEPIEGSVKIHKYNYPNNINQIFPDLETQGIKKISTTFDKNIDGSTPLSINFFKENTKLYKQYLNHKIFHYFKDLPHVIVTKNYINEPQIWIPNKQLKTEDYVVFDKFSLKIQFSKVSEYPELIIAYDDTSKMLRKSVIEVAEIVPLNFIKKIIKDKTLINYQKIDSAALSKIDLKKRGLWLIETYSLN